MKPDHIFPDGVPLQDVRDAIAVIAMANGWRLAHEVVLRYGLRNTICTMCGVLVNGQTRTFVPREDGVAICSCLKCREDLRRSMHRYA